MSECEILITSNMYSPSDDRGDPNSKYKLVIQTSFSIRWSVRFPFKKPYIFWLTLSGERGFYTLIFVEKQNRSSPHPRPTPSRQSTNFDARTVTVSPSVDQSISYTINYLMPAASTQMEVVGPTEGQGMTQLLNVQASMSG